MDVSCIADWVLNTSSSASAGRNLSHLLQCSASFHPVCTFTSPHAAFHIPVFYAHTFTHTLTLFLRINSRSRAGSPVGSPNSRSGRAASPQLSLEEKDTKPKTIHQTTRRGILPDIIPTPRVDPSLVQHDAPFCFKDPLELARRGLDNELKAILPQMGGVSKFGLNQPNERGRTPLMVAILNGKLESCLIIIKAGGLINETDLTGKTVLFYAIAKRSIETINALIDAGANPEAVDKFGRTPLMQGKVTSRLCMHLACGMFAYMYASVRCACVHHHQCLSW